MSKQIVVGIADLNVGRGDDVLVTYALGSCVGICLYDTTAKVGGLAHIMLPASGQVQNVDNPNKFADLAILDLAKKIVAMGASKVRIRAKIAGGAQMFASTSNSTIANIGQRNILATKDVISRLNIPIVAEDTGKNYGRTLYFSVSDSVMKIKSATRGEWIF